MARAAAGSRPSPLPRPAKKQVLRASKRRPNVLEWPQENRTRGVIDGPGHQLEVAISLPEGQTRGMALVCHPHPQHGGTMDNKVVTMLARAANEMALAAVRFNFRGVGKSGGDY